jgi:hypothetical protein
MGVLGLALTTTTTGVLIVMATPSYRERMKAERAAASAQRKAEQEAYRRHLELVFTTKRLARQLVIDGIRARGEKITHYRSVDITLMAEELITPELIAQARARLERRNAQNSKHLSNPRSGWKSRTSA